MQTIEIVVTGPDREGIYVAAIKESSAARSPQRVMLPVHKGYGTSPWQAIQNLSERRMLSER